MTTHAAGEGYAPGAGTKGRRLPPSEVFEVGDLLCEIYSQRATDFRWQGHVSIIQRGSRRRLDRFTITGSHETFGLLLAAARAAVESRPASEPSAPAARTGAGDGGCCLHKPTAGKRRLAAGSRPATEIVRANPERRHPWSR